MTAANPGRSIALPSVRSEFTKLIDRGIIRRVRKAANGCVLWAAAECEVVEEPIMAMTIPNAIAAILEERGPLTSAEIVVGLKERGYRPETEPRVLLISVRDAFKRNRGRFARADDGRWSVVV